MAGSVPTELRQAMDDAARTYQDADMHWFDFLDDEVTIYALQSTTPVVGREHYRRIFGPAFSSTKRDFKIIDQDVSVLTDTAVVAQTIQIEQSEVHFNLRQSVIWVKRGNDWKINHLHTAQIGEPMSMGLRTARSVDEIKVLNEKIATISAVLGVAQ